MICDFVGCQEIAKLVVLILQNAPLFQSCVPIFTTIPHLITLFAGYWLQPGKATAGRQRRPIQEDRRHQPTITTTASNRHPNAPPTHQSRHRQPDAAQILGHARIHGPTAGHGKNGPLVDPKSLTSRKQRSKKQRFLLSYRKPFSSYGFDATEGGRR